MASRSLTDSHTIRHEMRELRVARRIGLPTVLVSLLAAASTASTLLTLSTL